MRILVIGAVIVLFGCAAPVRYTVISDDDSLALQYERGYQLYFGERESVVTGKMIRTRIGKRAMGVAATAIAGGAIGAIAGSPAAGAVVGTIAGTVEKVLEEGGENVD